MRAKFICGNWKMYKTIEETRAFLKTFLPLVEDSGDVEVAVAPPFTSIGAAAAAAKGSRVRIGAQNVHWKEEGAFTGELCAAMLKEIGASFAIIGHSERRQYFGETDGTVNLRTRAALMAGLLPIVCVGETLEERDRGEELAVVSRQISLGLADIPEEELGVLLIAYEPVWAIGTGRTATAMEAQRMHAFIRGQTAKLAGDSCSMKIRILYGGSVKPSNAAEILSMPDVDGALVGGASLDAETFASIVHFRV